MIMDVEKVQGAWGYDVDSKEFVDQIRKGRPIEPLDHAAPPARKFYKTTYTLVILSEQPINEMASLEDLQYEITDGEFSGITHREKEEIVDGKTMAKLLEGQGSDPEFFRLDAEGNDLLNED
jgi:hypothetical protein